MEIFRIISQLYHCLLIYKKKDNDSDLLSLIFISYLLLQFGGILLDLT